MRLVSATMAMVLCVVALEGAGALVARPVARARGLRERQPRMSVLQGWRAAKEKLRPLALSSAVLLQLASSFSLPLAAEANTRTVGEISGSGFVFKDTLKVEAFEDPKIEGVTLYISDFSRPITDRLQKDFFSDPSQASIACAVSGNPVIKAKLAPGDGEEVLSEAKSLFFKTLRVRRLYDQEGGNAVYVVYNTRLPQNNDDNKSRFKSSMCAVHLSDATAAKE